MAKNSPHKLDKVTKNRNFMGEIFSVFGQKMKNWSKIFWPKLTKTGQNRHFSKVAKFLWGNFLAFLAKKMATKKFLATGFWPLWGVFLGLSRGVFYDFGQKPTFFLNF